MIKQLKVLLFSLLMTSTIASAQTVGISAGGGTTFNANSILDVNGVTGTDYRGMLLPRMTDAQKVTYGGTLGGTENGMTIFNTTFDRYEFWNGSAWIILATTQNVSGTSLDDAYDAGGLGAGRTITADQQAVQILDAGGLHVQGNVGIGTQSPATVLHVEKSAIDNSVQDLLRLQMHTNSPGFGGGIQFSNRWNNGSSYWSMARIIAIEQNGFGGQLIFSTNSGTGTADDVTAEAMRIDENGNVGIGITAPTVRLDVDGDVSLTGKLNSNGMQESSDRRFKKNISPLTGALNSVLLMEGVSYNWKQEEFPKRNFGDRTEIGVIAQDLEKIYPELVSTDAEGYKSVQYSHLVPVLLEAIKEQQVVISGMEKTVTELTLQNNRADAQYAELKRAISVLTVQIDDSHQTFDTITDEMKSLSGAIYGDGSVED